MCQEGKKKDSLDVILLALQLPWDKVAFIIIDFTLGMSTLPQEDLKLSLRMAAAWKDVSQLLAEGDEFAESKVCSLIFQ